MATDTEEVKLETADSTSDGDDHREGNPLLGTRGNHETRNRENESEKWYEKIIRRVVYFLYFLTGQFSFVTPSRNKSRLIAVYSFLFLVVCSLLNIFQFGITIADWLACTSTNNHYNMYYNVCYSIVLHPEPNTHNIPNIIMDYKNYSADSLSDNEDNLKKFTIYARAVLLLTSFSSMTSYIFFIIGFMKLFIFPHLEKLGFKNITKVAKKIIDRLWCIKDEDDGEENQLLADIRPLHPFDDRDNSNIDIEIAETDNSTSTRLSEPNQAISYYSILAVNIVINLAMLCVFVIGQYAKHPRIDDHRRTKNIQIFEIVGVTCYIYSLFCTLFSCFIFSKLAYGIQNKFKSLNTKYLKHVNTNDVQEIQRFLSENVNRDCINIDTNDADNVFRVKLYYLQEKDKHFSKVAKSTIKQFEFWFFFHWILYIVSSFLSLSLFFEVLIYYINNSLPNETSTTGGIDFHPLEIAFLGLFSASNVLFFLYPCIRAASVTNSRQVQISELNKIYMKYEHVSPELKERFAEYLDSQNAGFDLHILCVRVPFGFSVAYISIFIALFGVLLKVVTSI